jgi:hypothetical protein
MAILTITVTLWPPLRHCRIRCPLMLWFYGEKKGYVAAKC